jgi:hypothetical protein
MDADRLGTRGAAWLLYYMSSLPFWLTYVLVTSFARNPRNSDFTFRHMTSQLQCNPRSRAQSDLILQRLELRS